MSLYGTHWKIDGVQAAFVMRGIRNGYYCIVFERESAELPRIESINWAKPTIEHTNPRCPDELGLPEGYGFEVEGITYDYTAKSYTVEVRIAEQYLGDVTGYQSQIDELQAAADEKDSTIAQQAADISAMEAEIAEKDAAIESMKTSGTAEALNADLQAAYEEVVESNG